MRVETVTISGADDNTKFRDLVIISEEYPFVEWGILLSSSRSGESRYPSKLWLEKLANPYYVLNLSGHLCGKYIRDIKDGFNTFKEDINWEMFQRFQLNFAGNYKVSYERFLEALFLIDKHKQIIFQVDSPENELLRNIIRAGVNAVPLFDISGGRGKLPEEWPKPIIGILCGYAGGLSPDNIENQLLQLSKIIPEEANIWIDMESGVRTNDVLDMDKVKLCLDIVERYNGI